MNGKPFCEVARSTAEDIEKALDAAHKAKAAWGSTPVATRSEILLRIADRMQQNLETLAVVETWDNGKPIRETLAADVRPSRRSRTSRMRSASRTTPCTALARACGRTT